MNPLAPDLASIPVVIGSGVGGLVVLYMLCIIVVIILTLIFTIFAIATLVVFILWITARSRQLKEEAVTQDNPFAR